MNCYTEQARQTPVVDEYDIIVCGGGPSGVSAAISAARAGSRTLLVESEGLIGGVWTAGLTALVHDGRGKGGLLKEIRQALDSRKATIIRGNEHNFFFDVEAMKLLLSQLCLQAGVEILLYTRVTAAMIQDGRIAGVITESHGRRLAYAASVVIDCTGNGDVALQAGCRFERGHPETKQVQPLTMLGFVSGVPEDCQDIATYADKDAFYQFLLQAGFKASNKAPAVTRMPYGGLYMLSVGHQFDTKHDDNKGLTAATLYALQELNDAVTALRTYPGWENLTLISTPAHIGIREGNRIRGHCTITVSDLANGTKHADGVCTARFGIDIHALDAEAAVAYGGTGIKVQPYHIPLRSLIATDIENLGMAGRCISGDFFAHASYRVTGNCVGMGEAIGFAASMAVRDDILLREVCGESVAEEMQKRGYEL